MTTKRKEEIGMILYEIYRKNLARIQPSLNPISDNLPLWYELTITRKEVWEQTAKDIHAFCNNGKES